MASILNPSALTFSADQVRSINELVMEPVLKAPELSLFHTFVTGIKNDREIGIQPTTLGLIGKAAQGCGTRTPETNTTTTALKKWEPKRLEILLRQCYTDLESSFLRFARRTGINVYDLTSAVDQQNAYMAFVVDLLSMDIPKTVFRHAWFGDQSAANVSDSPAGVITDGVDVDYFNLINGFFYQLAVIYAATPARKTAISANAQATSALQFSAFSNTNALDALNKVIDDAPSTLIAQPDKILLATRSVTQRAKRALQALGVAYNITLQTNGMELMQWDGINLYTVPLWDEWIAAYENNGTKYNNPHRIVYSTKSNLNIGMEGQNLFDTIDVHYDKVTKYNYVEAIDAFDAKVLVDSLVQVGI